MTLIVTKESQEAIDQIAREVLGLRSSERPVWAPGLFQDLAEAIRPGSSLIAQFRRDQATLEREFIPKMGKILDELGTHVKEVAAQHGGVLIESVTPNEQARIDAIVGATGLDAWTKNVLQPEIVSHWNRTANMMIQTLNRADIAATFRGALAENILKTGGTRVGMMDIIGDTKSAMLRVVEDGRAMGLGPRQVAKMILQYVPEGRFVNAGSKYRALMIARTETLNAQRVSSLGAYEQVGIQQVVAYDGEEFDEECAARNGTVYDLLDAGAEAASTHPNCVLAFGPA